jgi:hypothetical protein
MNLTALKKGELERLRTIYECYAGIYTGATEEDHRSVRMTNLRTEILRQSFLIMDV